MANSKYEYVRTYERDEYLLPNTWIVVRIDGRGFHKLSTHYSFTKPNDVRALHLMNYAASAVVQSISDIVLAYGCSDEYSFVFHRTTQLFERRRDKLISTVVSTFTAAYVFGWGLFFGGSVSSPSSKTVAATGGDEFDDLGAENLKALSMLDSSLLPTFDARAVLYPGMGELRDYLSWRQVDCHINNLYNTTFWAMVLKGGMSTTKAEEDLKGTVSADKNEILWSRYGINYNDEPEMFRKGSVVFKGYALEVEGEEGEQEKKKQIGEGKAIAVEDTTAVPDSAPSKTQLEKTKKARQRAPVVVEHLDIIKDEFWRKRPWILSGKPGRPITVGKGT